MPPSETPVIISLMRSTAYVTGVELCKRGEPLRQQLEREEGGG